MRWRRPPRRQLSEQLHSGEHDLRRGLQRRGELCPIRGRPEPEGLGFRRADAQSDDFPAAFGVGCHGYYGCNRDDPPALTLLELGGIEPDIGPVAGQGAVQELADPFINVFAQL